MNTEEFKEDMHKRNGIEGTLSGLVRGQGMRTCRFIGKAKANLQMKLCGAAANIKRLVKYRALENARNISSSIGEMGDFASINAI